MLGGECDCWLRDSDEADYEEDQQVFPYSPIEPYIFVRGSVHYLILLTCTRKSIHEVFLNSGAQGELDHFEDLMKMKFPGG